MDVGQDRGSHPCTTPGTTSGTGPVTKQTLKGNEWSQVGKKKSDPKRQDMMTGFYETEQLEPLQCDTPSVAREDLLPQVSSMSYPTGTRADGQ